MKDQKEFAESILQDLRKQVLPLIEKELNRVTVATERMRILATRSESFTTQKAQLEKEIAGLKERFADVFASEDPGDLNRQICAKEAERDGLEERIESLSKGGDAYLGARKELEDAKADLQQVIHRAINSGRTKHEDEFNALLEKAWNFYQAWKSAIDSLYQENGSYSGYYLYSFFIDRKRSDFRYF